MSEHNMSEHNINEHNMSEHDKESFYVYNNKYIAKIEWNEENNLSEDNLYIGTLVYELRSYRDLALFEILFIFMGKIIMK